MHLRVTAQSVPGVPVVLPVFVLEDQRVANQTPASSFAAPVSALRFEPLVDLQSRGFGEAQGDIAVRGGIFEGTAMQVGGMTIFDPQTGHYAAELPVPPVMLGAPVVATGVEHALAGFNATSATIDYAWRPITPAGRISLAAGNHGSFRGGAYAGREFNKGSEARPAVFVDGGVSYSRSDGTIENGDHKFFRVGGRVQARTETTTTQFFGGHQSKFFGWPNLYTPFGVAETEDIQTTLLLLSHRIERAGTTVDAAAYYRINRDDYEFDRFRPGLFNPFEHETRVGGGMVRVRTPLGDAWTLDARAEGAADSIDSTSLTAGRFMSRSYWRIAGAASRRWESTGQTNWELRLGGSYDDTNRDESAFSPLAEIAWERADLSGNSLTRIYAQISESTRVPGYTALNSPSGGGLFRGNPDLGRENARNFEVGVRHRTGAWSLHAALFHRRDDPMVDWTFHLDAANARSAQAVKIATTGIEAVISGTWSAFRIVGGYGWLRKNADYFGAEVDASFYALNFPNHRFTLAVTAQLGGGFELRSDNEFRIQESNALRSAGGDSGFLSSLGLHWTPDRLSSVEFALIVDNLWADDFQEIPAVPAPGRQISAGATWRW